MPRNNRKEPANNCSDCAFTDSRRSFLRDIGLGVVAALTAAGATQSATAQSIIEFVDSIDGTDLPTYPIPAADGAKIDMKKEVILVRWQNTVFAFNLSCPHQNTALRWSEKDQRFNCPKHHSRYQPNGTFIDGRATRGMDRFNVTLQGANVVVDVNAMHKQDADPAGWAAAMVKIPPG